MRIYIIDIDGNMHPLDPDNSFGLHPHVGQGINLFVGSIMLCKDRPMSDLIAARDYITSCLFDAQNHNPTLVVIDLRKIINT